jgi:hypothetical protein
MPRGPRLDYPGALHHLIARGIERSKIFRSERDRDHFLDRLATLIAKTGAADTFARRRCTPADFIGD